MVPQEYRPGYASQDASPAESEGAPSVAGSSQGSPTGQQVGWLAWAEGRVVEERRLAGQLLCLPGSPDPRPAHLARVAGLPSPGPARGRLGSGDAAAAAMR